MTPPGEHFTGSTVIYAGCILTVSLNDDLGKWVRGALRDSRLKNVHLRMTELQYIPERCCQDRAQNTYGAGILPLHVSLCYN